MKKLHLFCVMALFAIIGLASCENPHKEADAVADKLEDGQKLTDQDVAVLINYVGEYAKKAQGEVDDEVNGTNTAAAQVDMEKLNKEYKNYPLFNDYLKNLDFTTLSKSNIELIGKYAHYEMFTVPPRMDFSVDPNEKAAGMIVDTPSDSIKGDSSVIATGVDEVKEVK